MKISFTRWVGTKRNDNFYFLYFSAFSNLFWLEMKPQWYYLIFWFFFFFFLEFFIACRVWTERKDNFYSLFLGISQPILAWNGAITVFFNLFNFFAINLEFSLTRQVGMKRNNNFYFLSLSLFHPILAWNHAIMVFFIFPNFFYYFFGIFYYASSWYGTERYFLFSLFSWPFPSNFGLKWSHNGIFLFFPLFLEFCISRRVGTERNGNTIFIFALSRPFPTFFGLKRSHNRYFFFWIFLQFFLNYLLCLV